MKNYKHQLFNLLQKNGWEILDQIKDEDWWVDEVWMIQSVRENWGDKYYIKFECYPPENVWEEKFNQSILNQGVRQITFFKSAHLGLVYIFGTKNTFYQEFDDFISRINGHRCEPKS